MACGDLVELCRNLAQARGRGKTSAIVVVAGGSSNGKLPEFAAQLAHHSAVPVRAITLGHIQRGGSHTASDRLLATELGAYAVELLLDGWDGVMAGILTPWAGALRFSPHFPQDNGASSNALPLERGAPVDYIIADFRARSSD